MWDIAPEFHAIIIFAEHRYYGKSMPYADNSYDVSLTHTDFHKIETFPFSLKCNITTDPKGQFVISFVFIFSSHRHFEPKKIETWYSVHTLL